MLSGSSLQRAEKCPASEALPHRDTISADSDRGTAVHKFLAAVPTLGRADALEAVDAKYRDLCAVIDLDRLPAANASGFIPEAAYVWDDFAGTVDYLGQSLGRNYGKLTAAQIPCTLDSVGTSADGTKGIVLDYKGGWSDAAPAAVNLQLRFGALCYCRANGLEAATVAIVRIKEDGSSWFDVADLTAWDLTVIEGQITAILDAVTDAKMAHAQEVTLKPTTGDHCRYCPAYASCPAVTSLAVAVGSGEFGLELTKGNAAEAWHRVKAMEKILKEVKAAVKTFAEIEPIDLGDGKMLGEVEGTRESLSGGVVYRVLREMYGEEAADAACEIKTSKAAIDRAIKPAIIEAGGKLAPAKRELLARVDELGGLHKRKARSVKEHKARIEAAK